MDPIGKEIIDIKENKMYEEMMERGNMVTFEDSNETKYSCKLCDRRPFRYALLFHSYISFRLIFILKNCFVSYPDLSIML